MFNIKIIFLIIGIIFISVGYINNQKKEEKKYENKVFPRNVYDEIYMSMPALEYNDKLYNKINMTYMMDYQGNYNNLFEKPIKSECNNPNSSNQEGCDIEFKPLISESERIEMTNEYFPYFSPRNQARSIANRNLSDDILFSGKF